MGIKIRSRKGISTFIATLLLMVLAVAAGVVIYAYVMGYLGSFSGPSTLGSISIDSSSLNLASTPPVTAYVRNIGHAGFLLDSVYINGIKINANSYTFTYNQQTARGGDSPNYSVPEGGVGELQIVQNPAIDGSGSPAISGGLKSGITYEIKLVGVDNTQLSFQIKG
jgi:hypothetical protein